MTGAPPAARPSVTFVTVLEAGVIEWKVVRLVESLRRFGGRLAGAAVMCVRPRRGPAPSRRTLERLAGFGATGHEPPGRQRYPWYHYLNKCDALVYASRHAETELICWIDDDCLVLDELPLLDLAPGVDLAICPSDEGILGTTGPGSPYESYWAEYCRVAGLTFDQLGWTRFHNSGKVARTYYNSGVMCFRRSSGYAAEFTRVTTAALDARFALSSIGVFLHEQMAAGVAARRLGLRVAELPWGYNFANVDLPAAGGPRPDVRLVHYHNAIYRPHFDGFAAALATARPDRAGYVRAVGPLDPRTVGLPTRARVWLRRRRWRRQQAAYLRTCRVVEAPA